MKVFLLSPPSNDGSKRVREGRCQAQEGIWTTLWPPVSMAQVASVLEEKGIAVKVTDAGAEDIDEKGLEALLVRFSPDVLMINTSTPSIDHDLTMAALAKRLLPDVATVAFGIHVSELPRACMEAEKALDFIIHNEPEHTTVDLVDTLKNGGDFSKILGLTYRDKDRIVTNPPRPYIKDLDALPFPAWHRVDISRYVLPHSRRPYLKVTPARGCPYHCVFCVAQGYYGKRLRMRSVESVMAELKYDIQRYGVTDFFFWTETFTMNRKFVIELCRRMQDENLQVRWVCNSRVDTIDEEMLSSMKAAGCWMISYGVESSSQEILDRSKKGITVEQIKEACRMTRKAGIQMTAHIVFGLPGDTPASIRDTVRFVRKMGFDYAQFYCATPWPGTELYKMAKQYGWLIPEAPWADYEQNKSVLNMEGLTADAVVRLRQEGFRSFYLYPLTIWRTLFKIRSLNELKNVLGMAKSFSMFISRSNIFLFFIERLL
ncbi:MAG: radical SAM protein [Deltaproteobacteria bacterium]|nr:radical SAM protein [Deltaproteobacteria bacterium]